MNLTRLPLILAFASCGAWLVPAIAAPAEISDVIHAAQPYGQGSYRFFMITAYSAQLWTDAAHWTPDVPYALTLTYDMHFSTDEMVSRSKKEMKHVDPSLSDAALSAYAAKLDKAFPPVAHLGDRITVLNLPGAPARFYYNGALTASIDDPALNRDFFSIWLSPRSSDSELQAQLVRGP